VTRMKAVAELVTILTAAGMGGQILVVVVAAEGTIGQEPDPSQLDLMRD